MSEYGLWSDSVALISSSKRVQLSIGGAYTAAKLSTGFGGKYTGSGNGIAGKNASR